MEIKVMGDIAYIWLNDNRPACHSDVVTPACRNSLWRAGTAGRWHTVQLHTLNYYLIKAGLNQIERGK